MECGVYLPENVAVPGKLVAGYLKTDHSGRFRPDPICTAKTGPEFLKKLPPSQPAAEGTHLESNLNQPDQPGRRNPKKGNEGDR
jgi:hypothetical protein